MVDFKYIVIGKGLIGGAATRYLSEYGEQVAVIGPDEPANQRTHDGVFASHYDQGRLTRVVSRDLTWARIARRAIDQYAMLQARSGITFYNPVGLLVVHKPATASADGAQWLQSAQAEQVPIKQYAAGDDSWRADFPYLDYPSRYAILHELAPAGYINPREMLRAQLSVAEQEGATIIRDTVLTVQQDDSGVQVSTAQGNSYRAERVLVAAGAFTNFNQLLPRPIPLKVKTETIILGRVSEADAERLRQMPIVVYDIEDEHIDDIYMAPPIRYPDGHYYIKMGNNTFTDQWPTTLADVQQWFREGNSDTAKGAMERALHAQFPDITFLSFETKRCIVCYTPSRYPSIDAVSERIFVATGGNGRGAKGSDTIGRLAAGFMHDGSWLDDIPREPFCVRDE